MDWKEQIVRYLLFFFENFSFFYIIFRKNFRKKCKRNIVIIVICCMAVILEIILQFKRHLIPFSENLLIICIILYFVFDVSVIEMIGLFFEQWLILSIIEMTMYVCLEPYNLKNMMSDNIVMLSILIFLWLYYIAIGKRFDRDLFQLPIKVLYLLDIIMLILTTMMEFFSYVVVVELPEGRVDRIGKILVVLGGSLICILLLAMMYYYNRTKIYRMQVEFAEVQNEQQREYFQQLIKREEETKSFRHDIIDDLLELQNYCEQGDYENLEVYLKNTLGIIENISKGNYDIGNDIINTVLNYYLKSIQHNYDVEVSGFVSENLSIEQRDLCIISSNLIKNAIEALKKLEKGRIRFEIKEGSHYVSIKVNNTFDGKLKLGKDGMPITTKDDSKSHGIGLQNVKKVVEKYEGKYYIYASGGEYQIEIFLKLH